MHISYFSGMLGVWLALPVCAQTADSLKSVSLSEVVITESYQHIQQKKTTLALDVLRQEYLHKHFTGNLMQTIGQLPGIQSMDIGSGFSKPMIRGMGFNRIAVTENGIKQEGQQWGADHGLEIDAFNIEAVDVKKGPSSLLYGSDAMGGVIEIVQPTPPNENQLLGEVALLGKSVNTDMGGSLMLAFKKNRWFTKVRFSEQHFGDYRIPADTLVYLTQRMPVHGRRMKNTAGVERNISLYTHYKSGRYQSSYAVSNAYQKVGFFPGAHGVPDVTRLEDDGNSRNIDLPYSRVNHLKVTTHQQYLWEQLLLSADLGYQRNDREEWSLFHTHYGTQRPPEKDPDKELAFGLNTYSTAVKARLLGSSTWEHIAGWEGQYQVNRISGYSFLLPRYKRLTAGMLWLTTYRPHNRFAVSGGIRYDYGQLRISPYKDAYLHTYLYEQGYTPEQIEDYQWRSYPVNRTFGDYSCSLGVVWNPTPSQLIKMNVGRSFRLPGANELAANGVHHGTFRHEQGDASLRSEQGWQMDVSYHLDYERVRLFVSPFASWFSNYLFLKPTGEWSILPHAGQIYRYTGAEAVFAGAEATVSVDVLRSLNYQFVGEYVYTYNVDEHIPLSFSPPASMRHTLTWKKKVYQLFAELQTIAAQNRVARNEDRTPGANLLHLGGMLNLSIGKANVELSLAVRNLFDVRYYNHLSFYRKIEAPEPGRNFQLFIKVPFNQLLK